MLKVLIIYGMTTPIPYISLMSNVMEMKQSLQTVIMRYHPLQIVIIMVLLPYFVKKVGVLEHTN